MKEQEANPSWWSGEFVSLKLGMIKLQCLTLVRAEVIYTISTVLFIYLVLFEIVHF